MKLEDIRRITIVGAGNMGSGIAEILSRLGGYEVTMADQTEELARRGLHNQRLNLQKYFVDKGKMTAHEMDAIIARMKTSGDISAAARDADYIIEAVFENMDLKKAVFKQLDAAAPPHAIIVSNTSYMSVTEMAAQTRRPENVAGMHFFNPVAVMKLVEVVRAPLTSDETAKTVFDLAKKLGKEPIYCRDTYGFIANRVAGGPSNRNDAVELVWARLATPEDVDKAVRLGFNRPLGPLELFDMIGAWKIFVDSEDDQIREFGWEKGHVHPLIKMMVRAGYTGGQGKKGMYAFYKEVLSKW